MSSHRIIRRADGGDEAGGAPVGISLRDLQVLGRELVQDVREQVRAAARERDSLEAEVARLRREAEQDIEERRAALEREAAAAREQGFARGEEAGAAAGRERGLEEGRAAGFEKGYREGLEAAVREAHEIEARRFEEAARPAIEAIRSLARELSRGREQLLEGARAGLIRLAIEVARKILRREVTLAREAVIDNVRRAVDLVFQRSKLVIQLHPEDLPVVERHAREALEGAGGLEDYLLEEAGDLGRGGCRVLSGSGLVDCSIETQLEVIEQALLDAAGDAQGARAMESKR